MVSRLISFNVGIEAGQFVAVYLMYLFGELLTQRTQWPRIEQVGFAVLVASGSVLSAVLTFACL